MKLADTHIASLSSLTLAQRPIPQALVLELLNHAVWAPTHRLREPWSFIYISHDNRGQLDFLNKQASAHLILTMKADNDVHKEDENAAAIFCLIQNFQLLAWEKKLAVKVSFHEWMYDRSYMNKLNVPEKEKLVAVLDLGFYIESQAASPAPSAELNWSLL